MNNQIGPISTSTEYKKNHAKIIKSALLTSWHSYVWNWPWYNLIEILPSCCVLVRFDEPKFASEKFWISCLFFRKTFHVLRPWLWLEVLFMSCFLGTLIWNHSSFWNHRIKLWTQRYDFYCWQKLHSFDSNFIKTMFIFLI